MGGICRKVVLSPTSLFIPTNGDIITADGHEVLFAYPNNCLFVKDLTKVVRSKTIIQEKKYDENHYIIYYDNKELFLPKQIWEPIKSAVNAFIEKGYLDGGILLYGAPGMGKSELAKLISKWLGIGMIQKRADDIMSKYLGESEQNMAKLFKEEIPQNLPTIVFMDEVDWLGVRRRFGSPTADTASTTVGQVLTVFLQLFQDEVIEKRLPVLFIATTNARLEDLDDAFKRRFPFKIYFTPPSQEMIEYFTDKYIKKTGKDTFVVHGKQLSKKQFVNFIVSTGISIAEFKTLLETQNFDSISSSSTYLRRVIPADIPEKVFDATRVKLNGYISFNCEDFNGRMKFHVTNFPWISWAILGSYIMLQCKKPIFELLPTDNLSVEELVSGLKQYEPTFFLMFSSSRDDYRLAILASRLKRERGIDVVFFSEDNKLFPESVMLTPYYDISNISFVNEEEKKQLIDTVIRFYGVEAKPDELNILISSRLKGGNSTSDFLNSLQTYILAKSKITDTEKVKDVVKLY